jgi:DNA invertase Pin-like site-specific DNA recombinase
MHNLRWRGASIAKANYIIACVPRTLRCADGALTANGTNSFICAPFLWTCWPTGCPLPVAAALSHKTLPSWECGVLNSTVPYKLYLLFGTHCPNVSQILWGKQETEVIVGYARTSTVEQVAGLEAQERDLIAAGVEKLFCERVSSIAERSELKKALEYLRDGDIFVVTKLDRLARSVPNLVEIVDKIAMKGASLRIMMPDIDTKTPTGKLMLNLLGSIAQFERELMLERQREGIAKAQAEGRYKGRAPTAQNKAAEVIALKNAGVGPLEISRKLCIGRSSVYRILGGS